VETGKPGILQDFDVINFLAENHQQGLLYGLWGRHCAIARPGKFKSDVWILGYLHKDTTDKD
jgi:hypothetical protein